MLGLTNLDVYSSVFIIKEKNSNWFDNDMQENGEWVGTIHFNDENE